jgi:hypothetical protein
MLVRQVRNMPDAATFECPNRDAQYKLVRAVALPSPAEFNVVVS